MPARRNNSKPTEQPPSLKRKRNIEVDAHGVLPDSDKENQDDAPPSSRAKRGKTATGPKTKAGPKTATPANPTKDGNTAKKLYDSTIKAIEANIANLDKKVGKLRTSSPNSEAVTTATYAEAVLKYVATASKLIDMDIAMAFNLAMALADASHTDLNSTIKMPGNDFDCDTSFVILDSFLAGLIDERHAQDENGRIEAPLPAVPKRWCIYDVPERERRNKQQLGALYRTQVAMEKERRLARRVRREETKEWMAVALSDLIEERDYLSEYGVEGYFPRSIAKLEELCKC